MKIKLYPCFEHWKRFQNIWIISDFHFSDVNSIAFRKTYPGDDEFVAQINKVCGKNDLLICLGDVGNIEYVKKLKGYKCLITGNHDRGVSNYQRKLVDGVDNHLFDEVYCGPVIINEKIVLSHEYLNIPYLFNCFGHHHDGFTPIGGWNCCAEYLGYRPISLKTIIQSGRLKEIESIHRVTIDAATMRSSKKRLP